MDEFCLKEINKDVASTLFNVYLENDLKIKDDTSNLIFPKYNNGKIRISEQEARIIFLKILDSCNYCYSIETPTLEKYIFSVNSEYENPNKEGRSACTDICIYDKALNRVVNIELKAHIPKQMSFNKDFEKLFNEEKPTIKNWFHLLENKDSGTFKSLKDKFITATKEAHKKYPNKNKDITILFNICVLKPKLLFQKTLKYSNITDESINDFFENIEGWN